MSEEPKPPFDLTKQDKGSVKRSGGAFIMAIGVTITLLCGLCTLLAGDFVFESAHQVRSGQGFPLSAFLMPIIFGGIPTVVGIFIFLIGLRIHREGTPGGKRRK